MQPYYQDATTTLYHGDCLAVLPQLPEAGRIATCLTDPPYGLAFMGTAWDQQVPGPEYWQAVQAVLAPGGLLLAFGGTRTHHRLWCAVEDAGFALRDTLLWLHAQGFPKSYSLEKALPAHPAWTGYGTALAPAWEPILLAMKPLAGTYAHNALTHGVAGLWIDGGRIPVYAGDQKGTGGRFANRPPRVYGTTLKAPALPDDSHGRWPKNVLFTCACPDATHAAACPVARLDAQAGERKSGTHTRSRGDTQHGYGVHRDTVSVGHDTTGSASRFFYCGKASRRERGADNTHPTVKPQALLRYLLTLTATPTGGLVLDPFCGSGSTLLAARALGRPSIGIEQDERFCETTARRLARTAVEEVA